MQEVGAEYGVTTGRRRRCGWLDLVVLRYSCLINGYTSLNLTKLDVLDNLKELKVAVAYLKDGQELNSFPGEFRDEMGFSRQGVSFHLLWKACKPNNEMKRLTKDTLGSFMLSLRQPTSKSYRRFK